MALSLRLSGIVEESIVDGPGLRYVVFTQGCTHHCPGCHNPHTHDLLAGYEQDIASIFEQFLENPLLSGMTFSGGEPFLQAGTLAVLGQKVKERGKNLVVYTGFTLEQLCALAKEKPEITKLLSLADLLIDGPYREDLRDLELDWRGSSNQRVIKTEAIKQALAQI